MNQMLFMAPGIVRLTGIFAIGLALVHLVAGKLRFLNVTPRSRWLSAASGICYRLEKAVKTSQRAGHGRGGEETTNGGVFWLHIGSFALYNALFGYLLLHRKQQGTLTPVLYFVAIAMHFLINDYGLRQDHRQAYKRVARWVLAGAIIAGWAIGTMVAIGEAALAALFAFLAGGIVLNVLKEELPEERQSRFASFAAGAAAYAFVLLFTGA